MNILRERRAQRANDVLRRPIQTAGLAKLLGAFLITAFFNATVPAGSITLAWDPSPSISFAGYNLYYGLQSGVYSSSVDEGTNLTATITGLTPGLTYYFASADYDTNGAESAFSNEVTNRVPVLPSMIVQPLTQTVIAGRPVTLASAPAAIRPSNISGVDGVAANPERHQLAPQLAPNREWQRGQLHSHCLQSLGQHNQRRRHIDRDRSPG